MISHNTSYFTSIIYTQTQGNFWEKIDQKARSFLTYVSSLFFLQENEIVHFKIPQRDPDYTPGKIITWNMQKDNQSEEDLLFLNTSLNDSYTSHIVLFFRELKASFLLHYYLWDSDTDETDLMAEVPLITSAGARRIWVNQMTGNETDLCWLYGSYIPGRRHTDDNKLFKRFVRLLQHVLKRSYSIFYYLSDGSEIYSLFHHYDHASPPDQSIKGITALRLRG